MHHRKSSAHHLGNHFDWQAVREQQHIRAAVVAGGNKLKQLALFIGHRGKSPAEGWPNGGAKTELGADCVAARMAILAHEGLR